MDHCAESRDPAGVRRRAVRRTARRCSVRRRRMFRPGVWVSRDQSIGRAVFRSRRAAAPRRAQRRERLACARVGRWRAAGQAQPSGHIGVRSEVLRAVCGERGVVRRICKSGIATARRASSTTRSLRRRVRRFGSRARRREAARFRAAASRVARGPSYAITITGSSIPVWSAPGRTTALTISGCGLRIRAGRSTASLGSHRRCGRRFSTRFSAAAMTGPG